MWWSGFETQVVPGAPCGCLLRSLGHELLLRGRRAPVARMGEGGLGSIVACSTTRIDGCVACEPVIASNLPAEMAWITSTFPHHISILIRHVINGVIDELKEQ